ncbi:hypothetical protein LTR27_000636 [Elasticomyces elasticus]|nr:hypothetical protein LTR27_000636 [Elasticomyces elasticus]
MPRMPKARPWRRSPNCVADVDIGALYFSHSRTYTDEERKMVHLDGILRHEQQIVDEAIADTGCYRATVVWLTTQGGKTFRPAAIVKAEKAISGVAVIFWLIALAHAGRFTIMCKLDFEGSQDELVQHCATQHRRVDALECDELRLAYRNQLSTNLQQCLTRHHISDEVVVPGFRLLGLPQELRTAILQFAMFDLTVLHVAIYDSSAPTSQRAWLVSPDPVRDCALLQVSKSVREQSMDAARLLATASTTHWCVEVMGTTSVQNPQAAITELISGLQHNNNTKLDLIFVMNTMATGNQSMASANNTTATKATSASADTTVTMIDHSITANVASLESNDAAAMEQTAPAATRVLGIPELLEAILIGTDAKTLLLSQRVAPKWRDLIRRSQLLQKKLFLWPSSLEEALRLAGDETGQVVLTRQSPNGAPAVVGVLNPLLCTIQRIASYNPVIELKFGALGDQLEAEQPSRLRMQLVSPHQELSMRLWVRNGRVDGESFQGIIHNIENEPLGELRQHASLCFKDKRGYNAEWTNAVMNVFGPLGTLSAQTVAEHLAARENR